VCVADSEADIYEVFAEPRGEYPVHWLIRACQNRALNGDAGQRLRDRVLATRVLYEVELKIRGRSAKLATEDRARRQNRETRRATVEVRAATVTLRAHYRPDRKLPPVTVNVVLVREPNPPAGETPVEWILVTTLPIDTLEQVRTIVEYYCQRWGIELFFKELKSTLGFHQYRFREFEPVEAWVELALTTFMYLEWYRVQQMSRRDLSDEEKRWWRHQRTYGLCQAVRSESEQNELKYIADCLETPGGMRRLKRLIRNSFPKEYRSAA
jgi:hypothetical protein